MPLKLILKNKRRFMDLLLLADEQIDMVENYLEQGEMFVLYDADTPIGVCVVTQLELGEYEIKNMAIYPEYQGKGYGKKMIECLFDYYSEVLSVMFVGTGDSPLTIPFYQSCGFVESHRISNFFVNNYDHPIFEAGVQLIDMVYLKREANRQ